MLHNTLAEAALEKRAKAVEALRAINNDASLTDADKRERTARVEADIDALTAEARHHVEAAEREAEIRELTPSFLGGPNTTRGEHLDGRWLDGELRALTGASGPGAAFTPSENSVRFFDRLAPRSVLLRSGINVITTDNDSVNIPRITGDPSASWVSEGSVIPATDGTADVVTATPRKLAAITQASNEVLDDSVPALVDVYAGQLLRSLGLGLDLAGFEGSGVAPSIRGLKNVAGINNISMGTNGAQITNLDVIADALGTLEGANATGRAIYLSPRSWASLSKLKEATGSNKPVLQESAGSAGQGVERSLYGVPVYLSSQLSTTETQGTANNASSIYVADVEQLYMVMRSNARVQVDSSRLFNQDSSELRAIMRADLVVANPAAVVRIAGVLP